MGLWLRPPKWRAWSRLTPKLTPFASWSYVPSSTAFATSTLIAVATPTGMVGRSGMA